MSAHLLVSLLLIIPALCQARSFSAPDPQGILGDYDLSGARAMSSMVRINSDGSYRFQYTAGRVDEQDEGTWTTNGFNLKFTSRAPTQAPSVTMLRSEKVDGPGVRIVFEGDHAYQATGMLDAVVQTRDRLVPANEISSTRALARDATLPVSKISLSLVGMLREYPKFEFTPAAPDHNQFVLTSAPGKHGPCAADTGAHQGRQWPTVHQDATTATGADLRPRKSSALKLWGRGPRQARPTSEKMPLPGRRGRPELAQV